MAGVLMGVGSGLWAFLWLDQWWANALIGAFTGLLYILEAPSIPSGMVKPTQTGSLEIGQWLGWKETMARPAPSYARDEADSMLPYAVALNVAQPWLNVSDSAPPWFGSGSTSSLQGADLDIAYRGFLHAMEWWLTGRSENAAKAAAQDGYELEFEALDLDSPDTENAAHRRTDDNEEIGRELEAQGSPPATLAVAESAGYQTYKVEGPVEEAKGGGCLCRCCKWLVSMAAIGVLVMVVLFSLDVVSPRAKPCPLDSNVIPTPAQIAGAGELFRDECVRVSGTVVFQDIDELLVEIDRGEYVQQVLVRVPTGLFEEISMDKQLTLGGRLKVGEDGTYEVDFVPDRESDREWWRNLLENLEGLF